MAGTDLDASHEQARWELLLEAVVSMGSGLSLDGLLERIVRTASSLVGARYAALGVLDLGSERRLRTFVHHGMEEHEVLDIGELPAGHGLLGLLIDRPEPVRLSDIAAHPASYGFPAGHPPMHSFLGVPVRTRDNIFGNLYLTEKAGGADFTEDDERIVGALAAAAGVAIENAHLYADVRRRGRWLEATAEITALLLDPMDTEQALQVVADRAREVADADAVWILSGDQDAQAVDEQLQVQVVSGQSVDLEALRRLPIDRFVARDVVDRAVPVLLADLSEDPRVRPVLEVPGWPVIGPAMFVPFSATSGFSGVLAIGWLRGREARQRELDPALPASFVEQAALSLKVSQSYEDRRRLAVFADRDRIGRDLHDLVIQRLFAVGLSVQGASRQADSAELRGRLEAAVDDLDGTIKDIRTTIFALGASENSGDVRVEVGRLVRRAATTLKFRPQLSFEGPVGSLVHGEAAADLLAVLTEALSNAARHAQPTQVEVRVAAGASIVLEVRDNGTGIAPGIEESGLRNMRQRAERRGGSCEIGPGPDGVGTVVRWSIPTGSTS